MCRQKTIHKMPLLGPNDAVPEVVHRREGASQMSPSGEYPAYTGRGVWHAYAQIIISPITDSSFAVLTIHVLLRHWNS